MDENNTVDIQNNEEESSAKIGERLKKFAEDYFDSVANLERALGKAPKSLSQYASGRNVPGAKLLIELAEKGCDVNWLLTGQKREIHTGVQQTNSHRSIAGNLSDTGDIRIGNDKNIPSEEKEPRDYLAKNMLVEALNEMIKMQKKEIERLEQDNKELEERNAELEVKIKELEGRLNQ